MKIGFIGTGNMGGALARAAAKCGAELVLFDRCAETASALAAELGCRTASLEELTAACDLIFIGVKPQVLPDLLAQLKPLLPKASGATWVSMAAGVPIEKIQAGLGGAPLIRIMPNTPVGVGAGMVLYACSENVTDAAKAAFLSALGEAGEILALPETLIDAGCALSGCGPAFVCMFAEALADGGVSCGLPRAHAKLLAAQTLLGTASLLLRDGAEPAALKDAVCSPGGTTIEGVLALEEGHFRGTVMRAVRAACDKAKKLS
ncbi:MAG: pyrroline-5-carboxylate reductase [Oscillospiraceae bacterium]|nr:pyrroline-5-carboxylate reductase [Oscillospiraceae bacterium]